MIQRIQSVWLLLAALTATAVFYTDVYRAQVTSTTGIISEHLRVGSHFPSLLVAVLMTLLPLVAIFLFRNRKKQRNMVWIGVLATIGFIAVNLMRISSFNNDTSVRITDKTYYIGSVLPVIVLIFLFLAIRGINKDEKLIRSIDRLR